MSNDQFRKVEDQFFLLRGQFETKRITREQFDAALKELMVQDADGRYWMMGADSGKWYVHDGRNWVEAQPPGASAAPPPPPRFSETLPPVTRSSNTGIIIGIGIVAVVLVLALAALFFAASQGVLRIGSVAVTPTPTVVIVPTIAPPTAAVVVPTIAPVSPTVPPPTATAIPPTAAPPSPTLPPPTATAMPSPTATPVPPTATVAKPTAVPASPTPAVAPGLYVTAISTDPAQVKDKQFPSFQVTFLNSLGANANVTWYIKIFEPDKKQSFGETTKMSITIPPGSNVFSSATNWKAVGATPCRPFIARVFYIAPDNTIQEFPKPGGDTFLYYFSICE